MEKSGGGFWFFRLTKLKTCVLSLENKGRGTAGPNVIWKLSVKKN